MTKTKLNQNFHSKQSFSLLPARSLYHLPQKNIFLLLRIVNRLAPPLNMVKFVGFPVQNKPSPTSPLPVYNTCLKKTFFLLLRKVNRLAPPLNVVQFFGFPVQNNPSPSLPLPAYNTCLKKTFFLFLRKVNRLAPL